MDEDFSFEVAEELTPRKIRKLTSDIIKAFEQLDDVVGAKPSQMHAAYRTIKIGQTIDDIVKGEEEFNHLEVYNLVIRTVLVEYPIGKEL